MNENKIFSGLKNTQNILLLQIISSGNDIKLSKFSSRNSDQQQAEMRGTRAEPASETLLISCLCKSAINGDMTCYIKLESHFEVVWGRKSPPVNKMYIFLNTNYYLTLVLTCRITHHHDSHNLNKSYKRILDSPSSTSATSLFLGMMECFTKASSHFSPVCVVSLQSVGSRAPRHKSPTQVSDLSLIHI